MALHVTVVGSGMIVNDQILPSLYHLQRLGIVGSIWICATSSTRLRPLAASPQFQEAFPGQSFRAFPPLASDPQAGQERLYEEVLAQAPPDSLTVIAVPEQMHLSVLEAALARKQHVLCVKPLVLRHEYAQQIAASAWEKGLFVGVEYHKRFDRRSLEARLQYRRGSLGEFRCGEAKLIEPWYYRHSNFQNWFTCANTDPFTYIGCHYVDLVYFITGLRPVEVSVRGVEGTFPNGKRGYMWSSGRVAWENGALLSVCNGLGYPDDGAGSNDQGMCLFCEGPDSGATLKHDDQFRGVSHGYIREAQTGKHFRYINPDYFRLVPWSGPGLRPVGYGYDSIEANVLALRDLLAQTANLPADESLAKRRKLLEEIDQQGILATPKNSSINELVIEAGRLSITHGGRPAAIRYKPAAEVALV